MLYAETSYDGGTSANTLVQGAGSDGGTERVKAGLLYYQAGVAVITASVFDHSSASSDASTAGGGGILGDDIAASASVHMGPEIGQLYYVNQMLTGSEISSSCDALRGRIYNLSFNNTTELNSTIYFCRMNHNEFNYSSNPTYLSGSKIRVCLLYTSDAADE